VDYRRGEGTHRMECKHTPLQKPHRKVSAVQQAIVSNHRKRKRDLYGAFCCAIDFEVVLLTVSWLETSGIRVGSGADVKQQRAELCCGTNNGQPVNNVNPSTPRILIYPYLETVL
jgi:hypothetical protein